jgi:hypothetical protein
LLVWLGGIQESHHSLPAVLRTKTDDARYLRTMRLNRKVKHLG